MLEMLEIDVFAARSQLQIVLLLQGKYWGRFEFLKYLEGCIEDNPGLNFMDFLDNMTQSHEDLLSKTGMRYGKGARLKFNEFPYWNEVKEKVIYNHF